MTWTKRFWLAWAWFLGACALWGCGNELGVCDPEEARRVVYDEDGMPAFEGQAMTIRSCGWGAFCHSDGVPFENRHGVPTGLEYDLTLASYGANTEREETERLQAMQLRAFEHRHEIWDQVASLRMPIVRADVAEGAPTYVRLDSRTGVVSPAPTLETPDGREVFRNWLACGLPVVERTMRPTDDEPEPPEVGYVVANQEIEPLLPDWNDIYDRLVQRSCNSSPCHGAAAAGSLDLRGGPDAALAALRSAEAGGARACGVDAPGTPLLVPGDPDGSLLFQKLRGRDEAGNDVCGDAMPVGRRVSDASLSAIRQWIAELR